MILAEKHKTSDEMIAHLAMIQGVINRLASNSTTMKTLAGTVLAAAIALYGSLGFAKIYLLLSVLFILVVFWFLDTHYLRIERAYRSLYDSVRKSENDDIFTMNYRLFMNKSNSFIRVLFSWSVFLFYGPLAAAIVVLHFILSQNCPI